MLMIRYSKSDQCRLGVRRHRYIFSRICAITFLCLSLNDIYLSAGSSVNSSSRTLSIPRPRIDNTHSLFRWHQSRHSGQHLGFKKLVQELTSCGVNSLVAFTESGRQDDTILKSIASKSLQLTHYDISVVHDRRVQELVKTSYVDYGLKNYILITKRPGDVISLAESVFHEYGKSKTVLMPHSTKWTVVVWSKSQLDTFLASQNKSVFDNVAVWLYHYYDKSTAIEVRTLLWNQNRSRRHNLIPYSALGRLCKSFPNSESGLNGRNIHAVGKLSFGRYFFNIEIDTIKNTSHYTGVLVDVLNLLAESLNFSYTISMTDLEWEKFYQGVAQGNGHIGLALWFPVEDYATMDSTFPFLFATSKGLYMVRRNNVEAYLPISTTIICPFNPIIFSILACALIFIISFFVVIECSIKAYFGHSLKRESSPVESTASVLFRGLHIRLYNLYWQIMPTMFNQGYLPNPTAMASRGVLWAWALFCVCFYAVYTGHLTSGRVRPDYQAGIQSFEELVSRGDYWWGVMNRSSIHTAIIKSKNPVFDKLNQRALLIPYETTLRELETTVGTWMKQKFVFIYYDNFPISFNDALGSSYQLKVIQEPLFQFHFGLSLPKNSELNEIFSKRIERFIDTGLMCRIMSKHGFTTHFESHGENDTNFLAMKERSVHLPEILIVLIIALGSIGLAGLVLATECIIVNTKQKAADQMATKSMLKHKMV